MALSGRGMCSRLARPHRSYFLSAGGSQYVIKSKASQAGTMPTATDAYAKLQNRKVSKACQPSRGCIVPVCLSVIAIEALHCSRVACIACKVGTSLLQPVSRLAPTGLPASAHIKHNLPTWVACCMGTGRCSDLATLLKWTYPVCGDRMIRLWWRSHGPWDDPSAGEHPMQAKATLNRLHKSLCKRLCYATLLQQALLFMAAKSALVLCVHRSALTLLLLSRELAIQLRRDVKPALDVAGVKLFLVSIGTKERSVEFAGEMHCSQ